MLQIRATNLPIGYNFHPVLRNLNFSIEYGDYVCIIGSNGVGKSTLIKTILGLFPPISGKIHYDKNTKLESIGYLQQRLEIASDFPASVYEVVLSGCLNKLRWRPFYTKKEKAQADRNMKLLDIEKIRNKSFKELSGGQMQRVLIARAICATNKLIILDEPFVGLDPQGVQTVKECIIDYSKNKKHMVIFSSHNLDTVCELCDKVCVIENGEILAIVDMSEENSESRLKKLFI